jgi:hypothetical protein
MMTHMNLFEAYSKEEISSIWGEETVKKLNADHISKPFCDIVFDFRKGHDARGGVVVSTARLTDDSQKVYYLLKWDTPEAAPGGNHLGQQNVDYSGRFVEDKDVRGIPITVPKRREEVYFNNNIFYFVDNIQQDRDIKGQWTFMILVCDKDGNELCKKTLNLKW